MRVGVVRVERQRPAIVLECLVHAPLLVVEIALVEFGQRVAGVGLDSLPIVLLGFVEFAQPVVDGAQVHQRSGGPRVQFQDLAVGVDGLVDGCAGFFQIEPLLEPGLGFAGAVHGAALALRKTFDGADLGGIEIEQDLAAHRLHLLSGDVHRDAFAVAEHAQLGERLLDPTQLLAQRREGAGDLAGGDLVLAQFDQGLEQLAAMLSETKRASEERSNAAREPLRFAVELGPTNEVAKLWRISEKQVVQQTPANGNA